MNKGGGTQTTTQNVNTSSGTNYAPWTQQLAQGLAGAAVGLNADFLKPSEYAIAGFNPDQLMGMDLARQTAQGAYNQQPISVPSSMDITPAKVGDPTMANAASLMPASMATARQIDANAIPSYMNPYMQSVIDPAVTAAKRARDETMADIGARSAAAGSFGGSREALSRGLANRNYNEQVQQLVANLMAQGYDRATALAQADAATRQQTELANQGAQNQAQLQQSAYEQAMNQLNASTANQFALQDAQFQQQANMALPDYVLRAATLNDSLRSSDQNRQMAALQALLGTGQMQQDLAQNAIDLPNDALARIAAYAPGLYDASTWSTSATSDTKPDNSPSPLQQLIGGVGSVLTSPIKSGETNLLAQLLGV